MTFLFYLITLLIKDMFIINPTKQILAVGVSYAPLKTNPFTVQ